MTDETAAAPAAPNAGNIFDSIVKPTWLNIVHAFEGVVEPTLVAQAKTDVQTATDAAAAAVAAATPVTTAAATASSSVQAVIDQGANAVVNAAVSKLSDVPVIGPLIVGDGEAVADEATDAGISALITYLQGKLSTLKL
jgi:hypothetical protein